MIQDGKCLILLGALTHKYHPEWYAKMLDDTMMLTGDGSLAEMLNSTYSHCGMNIQRGTEFSEIRKMLIAAEEFARVNEI